MNGQHVVNLASCGAYAEHNCPTFGEMKEAITRALRCGLADVHGALGISRGCDPDTLHKAWRRACLDVHPDRNRGNEEAAARAQQIVNAAHDLLVGDPDKLREHESKEWQKQRQDVARKRAAERAAAGRERAKQRAAQRESERARGQRASARPSSATRPRAAHSGRGHNATSESKRATRARSSSPKSPMVDANASPTEASSRKPEWV